MPTILAFDGRSPEIDETAWVAPNATVIGAARLHPESSVFYGAVIRADSDSVTLGARSNLQDNVVVHVDHGVPAVIGSGVSVGHGAVVHGCTIEDDCLIGMNATVLNRAVVGHESLVAGVPAKVRRELTDDEVAGIRRNADGYVQLSAAHRGLA